MWQFQQVFPVSYKYFLGKLFSQAISVAIDYWITKGHTKVHYNSLARIMTYMSCFWIYHTIRETKGALNQVAWLQNSAPVYIWSLLLNTNTYLLIWKSVWLLAVDCHLEVAHLLSWSHWLIICHWLLYWGKRLLRWGWWLLSWSHRLLNKDYLLLSIGLKHIMEVCFNLLEKIFLWRNLEYKMHENQLTI